MRNLTARHFFAGCFQVVDLETGQPVGATCRGFQGYSETEARLFAAAPAMAEAARTLIRRIERDNLHTTNGVDLRELRAALALLETKESHHAR